MASTVGLKSPDLAPSRSVFAEVESYPLMSSPKQVLTILAAYLLFVLKLGPMYMKNREAFTLKKTMIAYNAFQVVFSLYQFIKDSMYLMKTDFLHSNCYINDVNFRDEIISIIWTYFFAKVTELSDTVFFILRKKNNQVSFLHVYHHSLMMIGPWAFLKYTPSENVIFMATFNSLVHVFMYTYYGLAGLGPKVAKYLTWKKYMTTMQLVQFVSLVTQFVTTFKYSECPPPKGVAAFIVLNLIFFMYLFANFYKENYVDRQTVKEG